MGIASTTFTVVSFHQQTERKVAGGMGGAGKHAKLTAFRERIDGSTPQGMGVPHKTPTARSFFELAWWYAAKGDVEPIEPAVVQCRVEFHLWRVGTRFSHL